MTNEVTKLNDWDLDQNDTKAKTSRYIHPHQRSWPWIQMKAKVAGEAHKILEMGFFVNKLSYLLLLFTITTQKSNAGIWKSIDLRY